MTGMAAATIGEASDLLGAVAWPMVALVICLIFRAPLMALLSAGRRRDQSAWGLRCQREGAGRGGQGDCSGLG